MQNLSFKHQPKLTASEQTALKICERKIEQGLNTFVEVGQALSEIRENLLYRETHNTFEAYCHDKWGLGIRQSQRFINASQVVENLRKHDQEVVIPYSESQIRPLTSLSPEHQKQVWENITLENDKITAGTVTEAVRHFKNDKGNFNCDLHFSSAGDEWYTPQKIIEPSLLLLGRIDLDPCSNCKTNPNVQAERHFTKEDDGLSLQWKGSVFLNPPYGSGIKYWTEKLVYHHECGDVPEAVALLPARTDTIWLSKLREYPRCFVRGKLHFSGAPYPAPFPSVVIYLGRNIQGFKTCFENVGDIYRIV